MGLTLGIETSCDETAAALVDDAGQVRGAAVQSQIDLHRPFGGVVPEIAGRSHVEWMLPVMEEAFRRADAGFGDVDGVAVTYTPGLIGSLLVGLSAAKALALALDVPLVAVDHVEAHVFSCFLGHADLPLPMAALVASGGHSSLFRVESHTRFVRRGDTIDDAPGEAFDKVAALLGLAYPGGPSIERAARDGDPQAIPFPRTLLKRDSLDFSFSGLKTAVLYHCRGPKGRDHRELSTRETADVAASFQEAVVDVLVKKLLRLAAQDDCQALALGGGVAANGHLRERLEQAAAQANLPLFLAPRELTTDNAVMIAGLGRRLLAQGRRDALDLDAYPSGTRPPL